MSALIARLEVSKDGNDSHFSDDLIVEVDQISTNDISVCFSFAKQDMMLRVNAEQLVSAIIRAIRDEIGED